MTSLIAELPAKFGVSPSSIRTYGSSGDFELEDGVVRRRKSELTINTEPEDSRGLYWKDGGWQLLIIVTKDHLRGSGFGVPAGVIKMLGVKYNEEFTLPNELGPQRVSWNATTTTVGTIKRLLDAQDIKEGERIWLDFHNGESFNISRARPVDGHDGLAGVAEHVGADPNVEQQHLRSEISRSLGLGENAANRKILSRFRARYDTAAVELLEQLWL